MADAAICPLPFAIRYLRRPDFSFYFIPLLKRLLPDLLVMGRRGDKLRYLLRLLLPPRAWLRDYCKLSDTLQLRCTICCIRSS